MDNSNQGSFESQQHIDEIVTKYRTNNKEFHNEVCAFVNIITNNLTDLYNIASIINSTSILKGGNNIVSNDKPIHLSYAEICNTLMRRKELLNCIIEIGLYSNPMAASWLLTGQPPQFSHVPPTFTNQAYTCQPSQFSHVPPTFTNQAYTCQPSPHCNR